MISYYKIASNTSVSFWDEGASVACGSIYLFDFLLHIAIYVFLTPCVSPLEATHAAESALTSEEQSASEPGDNKEEDLKCVGDRTEEMVPKKEVPALSPQDDKALEGETSLADITVEKAHESEE